MSDDKLFIKNGIETVKLSDWLDWCSGKVREDGKTAKHIVALPLIQRGSVWKPAKIIDLWDSLLRGMPVGSFMVETIAAGTSLRQPGKKKSTKLQEDAIGLLDGQQRTLAMLAGWPRSPMSGIRLWVDFADKPYTEHLFRLRVTTENHPFGFQWNAPSVKLPVDDRRKAVVIYRAMGGTYAAQSRLADYTQAVPYAFKPGLPIDIYKLIGYYEEDNAFSSWKAKVIAELVRIKNYRVKRKDGASEYEALEVDAKEMHALIESGVVTHNLEMFHAALSKMMRLVFPLIEIKISDMEDKAGEGDNDPPLAILFKRVGSNGEPLSNEDYIFSVIKNRQPETHDLVESLLSPDDEGKRDFNIANLLTPTDIVSTAVRLAAASYRDEAGKPIIADAESFNKNQFHRLANQKTNSNIKADFIQSELLPLIDGSNPLGLRSLFDGLASLVRYIANAGGSDIGFPPHSLWLLKRPLLQVMLYWLQSAILDADVLQSQRLNALRFIMFWVLCVTDEPKASKAAFELIGGMMPQHGLQAVFLTIYQKLVSDGYAHPLFSPDRLSTLVPSVIFVSGKSTTGKPLVGWRRFDLPPNADDDMRKARDFYRRWWGNGHHYHHSLLFWLQRDYIATEMRGSPVAGREEDTPYDFDHILPQSHWFGCSKVAGDRILEHMENDGAHHFLGNSIGNVRIWDCSKNRHDGDDSPDLKLANAADRRYSLIDESHWPYWNDCSVDDLNNKKKWSATRASGFQLAVEKRAFDLYEKFYSDLRFGDWTD